MTDDVLSHEEITLLLGHACDGTYGDDVAAFDLLTMLSPEQLLCIDEHIRAQLVSVAFTAEVHGSETVFEKILPLVDETTREWLVERMALLDPAALFCFLKTEAAAPYRQRICMRFCDRKDIGTNDYVALLRECVKDVLPEDATLLAYVARKIAGIV